MDEVIDMAKLVAEQREHPERFPEVNSITMQNPRDAKLLAKALNDLWDAYAELELRVRRLEVKP